MSESITTRVAIIGGGIAGLWVLNLLRARGVDCQLFERDALGAGQTLAGQGIIHGGVKYTLTGLKTPASETIAAMPGRWQDCLTGQGEIDLRQVRLLSDDCHMFTDGRARSKLTAFFASRFLRGRIRRATDDLPEVFTHPQFSGNVYRLGDPVLDAASLLRCLAAPHADRIHYLGLDLDADGRFTSSSARVQAEHLILTAGEGNLALLEALQVPVKVQRRPLNQVIVRGDLPPLYAHAVSLESADKPLVTITSHERSNSQRVWYLGGGLAEETDRSDAEQIDEARKLMRHLFPWLNWQDATFSTWRIDRAEPCLSDGILADSVLANTSLGRATRPDTPFVERHSDRHGRDVTVCWPTKLTLTPLLGDLILKQPDFADLPIIASPPNVQVGQGAQADTECKIASAPWEQPP